MRVVYALLGFFIFVVAVTKATNSEDYVVHYLEPGSLLEAKATRANIFRPDFKIFCYRGRPQYLIHFFHTIHLQILIEDEDYSLYEASTPEILKNDYENKRSIFSFSFLANKKKVLKLNPFNQTCIGIEAQKDYSIYLNLIRIDFWKIIYLCVGLFIFFSAPRLSENPLFYYASGILLGIFASFLVVVYLASKLIPRKPMMYGVMLGGWTLGIYFAQMLWENIQIIIVTYQVYAFWYVLITGFISFVICYRMGPPQNKRSKNLIKWGLQLAALILIFFSSDFQEASAGIDILAVLIYYFPTKFLSKGKGIWYRRFPPKPRLLTNEEYYEQGAKETAKALEDLRNYCSSPECKQWRTIMKLKDPRRFASFMEGDSHIDDSEILEYEVSMHDVSDDDSSSPENDENESNISEDDDGGLVNERSALPSFRRQPSLQRNSAHLSESARFRQTGNGRHSATPTRTNLTNNRSVMSSSSKRTNVNSQRHFAELSDDD